MPSHLMKKNVFFRALIFEKHQVIRSCFFFAELNFEKMAKKGAKKKGQNLMKKKKCQVILFFGS